MSHYKQILIETYVNTSGGSSHSIRARPVKGQKIDVSLNVECSSKMRKSNPVGTKFLIEAKMTSREGGNPFLYAHYNSPYEVVSEQRVKEWMAQNFPA